LIAEGQVKLNRRPAKSSSRLKSNDLVQLEKLPPRESPLTAEPLPLDVLYEDCDLIIINKAPGMAVHPAAGRSSGTVVNALLYRCPDLPGIGGERRPGIVHRLDKDTSGVMVIAKNDTAYQQLARQFKERTVSKEYLALVWGKLQPVQGTVDRPIGRHRSDRKRMSSLYSLPKKRQALTEWSVEKYYSVPVERSSAVWLSWIRVKPRTGRTHQIRVHLADLKYPLVGESVYSRRSQSIGRQTLAQLEAFPRQALHAERLIINHPRSRERMKFSAPLPNDLRELLGALERQSLNTEVPCQHKRY
jgi:23S rRNA pseudouridine1911/1915/1917 synthase